MQLVFVGECQTLAVVDPDGFNSFDLLSANKVVHESEVSLMH